MDNSGLRMPADSFSPCLFCNRKFLRAEAHWSCKKCRTYDERAKCPENCDACDAMENEEWRKKALEISEYKRLSYYKYYRKQPFSKVHYGARKGSGKPKPKSQAKQADPKLFVSKSEQKKKVKSCSTIPVASGLGITAITPYTKRLMKFEDFLFEELNPEIPESLVEKGFVLPKVPPKLKEQYEITRCELVRLMSSSSICYHLSKNRTQFCDENNQIFNASSDGIVSLFASLIKHKANTLGKIIFEIREQLLANVTCSNPNIIRYMIKGPIVPSESFFGNIDDLRKAVEEDDRNVLKLQKSKKTPEKAESDADICVDFNDSD